MVSIIILTKNEENDLPICLDAISWCDDIHILDSYSSDRTVEVAQKFGVQVYFNTFESFGKQRNYAIDQIQCKYDWILFLDADEVVTEQFKISLLNAISHASTEVAGFYCCWKMILEDKWLKHCDNFPKWQFRVLRKGRGRFKDFGHGQKEAQIDGRIEYIKEPYLHYGFSKGWALWFERHNRYSSQEAHSRLRERPALRNIFSRHQSTRNPALKSLMSRIPGWPLLRFTQAYIFKLGFLEGMPGFIYCINMSYYEFMIQIKMRELRKKKAAGSVKMRIRETV
ncbi:MAG: glycosyltransferase family 2 protein [Chitinophagaceae bacterium]|nr:MAG: glycosyltransferase family 2 protein [Chitinophagaceae bacterium]